MGVLRSFTVELDPNPNPNGVYYTGQTISGAVKLDLKEEMKMRGISLSFTGSANVKWTKVSKENRQTYKSNEKYVDETIVIYGKGPGKTEGKNPVHPSGNFSYPFRIQIPANIPSSFKGKFGQISYTLKATIDKPWKINDNSRPIQLTIHRYVDLNREPNSHIAPQAEASVTANRLFCLSGTVNVICSPLKSGYTPGEEIIVNGQIENNTGKRLHTLATKLTKEVTYYSKGTSHKDSEVLTKTKLSPVPQPDKCFWSGNLKLKLPISATPFRLDNCNIIDLKYLLHFTVILKGGKKLKAEMEISVGSVALPLPGDSPSPAGHGQQNTGLANSLTMSPNPVQYGQGFYPSHTIPRHSSHHGHHQFQHGPPQISPSAPPPEFITGAMAQPPLYLPPSFPHHQTAVPQSFPHHHADRPQSFPHHLAAIPQIFPHHQEAIPPGPHQAAQPVVLPDSSRKSLPMGGVPTPFMAREHPVRPMSYPAPSAPSLPPPYTPFPT